MSLSAQFQNKRQNPDQQTQGRVNPAVAFSEWGVLVFFEKTDIVEFADCTNNENTCNDPKSRFVQPQGQREMDCFADDQRKESKCEQTNGYNECCCDSGIHNCFCVVFGRNCCAGSPFSAKSPVKMNAGQKKKDQE